MKPLVRPTPAPASAWRRHARTWLPFLVSAALLGWVFHRIDARAALAYLTPAVLMGFLGPLVVFNFATLAIEAQCLHRVARASGSALPRTTAARIKAASYLLGLLNYAIGAAGLSVLLRRRTGAGLARSAGMVFLISLFDIGSVLLWVGVGAALLSGDVYGFDIGLRIGLIVGLIAAIVAGFVFLRLPFSMGLLERLRELDLLRAPRHAPPALLLELGLLRLLFVGSFVALAAALFAAFGIEVGAFRLAMNVGILLVVSALPIAAGGLGTGQVVFVELFSGLAPDAQLLSASIVFSLGMILARAVVGFVFAAEFTREALEATREERAGANREEGTGPNRADQDEAERDAGEGP